MTRRRWEDKTKMGKRGGDKNEASSHRFCRLVSWVNDWPLGAASPDFIRPLENRHHRKAKLGKPDGFEGTILVIKIIHIIFVPNKKCLIDEFEKREKMMWGEKVVVSSPVWGDEVPWNYFLLWIWEKPPLSPRYLGSSLKTQLWHPHFKPKLNRQHSGEGKFHLDSQSWLAPV